MRSIIFSGAAALMILAGCDVRRHDVRADNNALTQQQEIRDPTTVQLIDSVYDFGKVSEGDVVEYSYRFKNTGNKPLVVTNVGASCGCTVPEKPDEPIQPGATGFIKVKFNSANHPGKAHKTITVSSNADPYFPELLLTGEVEPKKEN